MIDIAILIPVFNITLNYLHIIYNYLLQGKEANLKCLSGISNDRVDEEVVCWTTIVGAAVGAAVAGRCGMLG